MNTCYVDLETKSCSTERLALLKPEFSAGKNLKDPVKIKAAIEEKEAEWQESAALSAVTGEILVAGWLDGESGEFIVIDGEESSILENLWIRVQCALNQSCKVVGFCSAQFDWPFAMRRSFLHGIKIPRIVRNGRYLNDDLVDVAELWTCGVRGGDHISLDSLAKFLGIGQKNGKGKDFAALWAADKPKALEYLRNDLALTKAAYERMAT